MQNLTLTLDGLPIDLPPDAALALSYRSSDLRRLDTREAAFSETFGLPLSAANANALGHPHALSSQTRSPYRRLPAVLRAGGVPVLRGAGIVEASEGTYEVQLLDDTADLFGRVGEARLRDLDLSAYDHLRTYDAIAAAVTDAPARGYVYALADAGYLGARPAAERIVYDELPASVYASTVLRALVARALPGFALTGALLADERFQRLVLPGATAGPRLRAAYLKPYQVQAAVEADTAYTMSGVFTSGGGGAYVDVVFPALAFGDAAHFDGTGYTFPGHLHELRVSARLYIENGPSLKDVFILTQNTVAGIIYETSTPIARGFSGLLSIEATVPAFALPPGQPLRLRIYNSENLGPVTQATITVKAGSVIAYTVAPYSLAGAPVHLDASLPDWSEAEFLKLLANQFNGTFAVDAARRTVRFDLFNELERRRAEAPDWSAKLDYAVRPRLEYRLAGYAQQNLFRYHDAPAAYAPAFGALTPAQVATQVGRGAIPVPDLTLPATADTYEAVAVLPMERAGAGGRFAAAWVPVFPEPDLADPRPPVAYVPGGNYRGKDKVWWRGRAWTSTRTSYGVPAEPGLRSIAGSEWAADSIPDTQVAAVALLATVPPVLLSDAAPGTATFTVAVALTRAGLSFADLLPAYHEGTARILARVQLLVVYLTLNAADVAGLDFSRPVRLNVRHIPGYGDVQGLFYLNLIDQYRPGRAGSARVELLRLGAPIAGLAPAARPLPARPAGVLLHESGEALATENGLYLVQES